MFLGYFETLCSRRISALAWPVLGEENSMDGDSVWAEQEVVVHNLHTLSLVVYPHFHKVIVAPCLCSMIGNRMIK